MLKLSKMTDYAVVISAQMARHPERLYAAADLADEIGLPKPTVSKLLKMLVKAELLVSRRGTQGGYQLLRSAAAITASDLIAAIEGPVAMTECSLEDSQCDLISQCGVATNWQRVTQAIHELLASVTLAQLAQKQPIKLPWVQIQTLTLHEAG
jgi:FeS assembly SUF system regulator